jgi:hypothetical protein
MVMLNSSIRRDAYGKIVGVGQEITILNEYKENLEFYVTDSGIGVDDNR